MDKCFGYKVVIPNEDDEKLCFEFARKYPENAITEVFLTAYRWSRGDMGDAVWVNVSDDLTMEDSKKIDSVIKILSNSLLFEIIETIKLIEQKSL